jgi:uncharacterized LabA/DUF88 family protein
MTKVEKVQIFVDGGNFYHLVLKKLNLKEIDFLFDNFAEFIAQEREVGSRCKRYYVGTVREIPGNQRSVEAMSKQTSHFSQLKKGDWEIKTSKLRSRREKIFIDPRVDNFKSILKKGINEITYEILREKGIDVKIATDLIVGAVDNRYDTAIVISSDADLTPAIDWIRNVKKKKVEYIGFSIQSKNSRFDDTNPSLSLISHSDIQRILVAADIEKFIKPKLDKDTTKQED